MPSLDDVYEEIQADPYWDHLRLPGIKFVPGYGSLRPKALIVGEAPGAVENSRLRPFCGPSGKVLGQLMAIAGLSLEDGDDGQPANAFVTNVVKYRPPGNRTPSLPEIMHAREGFQIWTPDDEGIVMDTSLPEGSGSLRREWQALGGPRVLVLVGGTAHTAISPMNRDGVTKWAGKPIAATRTGSVTRAWTISMLHPAYGLRKGPRTQKLMESHWEALGEFLQKEELL